MNLDIITVLVGGGFLTVVGGIASTIFNNLFGLAKSKADVDKTKADVARIFNQMSAEWAKSVGAENRELREELRELRGAVERLTDAVDHVIPVLGAEESSARLRLVEANTLVKRLV